MKRTEIIELNDSELFVLFHDYVVQLVKEANSVRGETKKTTKEFQWTIEECIKRFNLDRDTLLKSHVIEGE